MSQEPTHGGMYHSQCQLEKATRVIIVIKFVLAVLASVAAVWALRGEREKWRNVVEMKDLRHRPFKEEEDQYQ